MKTDRSVRRGPAIMADNGARVFLSVDLRRLLVGRRCCAASHWFPENCQGKNSRKTLTHTHTHYLVEADSGEEWRGWDPCSLSVFVSFFRRRLILCSAAVASIFLGALPSVRFFPWVRSMSTFIFERLNENKICSQCIHSFFLIVIYSYHID